MRVELRVEAQPNQWLQGGLAPVPQMTLSGQTLLPSARWTNCSQRWSAAETIDLGRLLQHGGSMTLLSQRRGYRQTG
jgi:hypothetical protein